jgi:hypothetical protein
MDKQNCKSERRRRLERPNKPVATPGTRAFIALKQRFFEKIFPQFLFINFLFVYLK